MKTPKQKKTGRLYQMIYKGRIYTGYNKTQLLDLILNLKRK